MFISLLDNIILNLISYKDFLLKLLKFKNLGPMYLEPGPMYLESGPMYLEPGPMHLESGPMYLEPGPMHLDLSFD